MRKKQIEELNKTIKRYQATEHITVLNLRNPTSWREYKDSLEWLEDFRTEDGRIGNLNNMHLLCVPKGRQLKNFLEKMVEFLSHPPAEPFCYRHLLKMDRTYKRYS